MINKFLNNIYGQSHFDRLVRLFGTFFYISLGLQLFLMIGSAEELWGVDAIISKQDEFFTWYNIFTYDFFKEHIWFTIGFYYFIILLGIFSIKPLITAALNAIFTYSFFFSVNSYTNAGHHLSIQLSLFFLFMLCFRIKKHPSPLDFLWNIFSNLGVNAGRVLVCLLYFIAAGYKLTGENWLSGNAFEYVILVDEFSLPAFQSFFLNNSWVMILATYFGLVYQVIFPVAVWFKKIKIPLLIAGAFFHLSIMFLHGLPGFGFVMICSYLLFLSNKQAIVLSEKLGVRRLWVN